MFDFLNPRPSKDDILNFAEEVAILTAKSVHQTISKTEYKAEFVIIVVNFQKKCGF